jgi:hypothetical protein
MPKSPTARLGIPRYEDSETAAFSFQVNAISEAVDAKAAIRKEGAGIVAAHTGSGNVEPGEHVLAQTNGSTWTLPTAEAGVECAVTCATGVESVTVKAGGTAKIYGDFLEGVASCTLLAGQHVTLRSDGTNWFITAGTPKQGSSYGVLTARVSGTEYAPSATRPTLVVFTPIINGQKSVEVFVGGQVIAKIDSTAGLESSSNEPLSFIVPPGQKWKFTGSVTSAVSTYLTL